MATQQEVMDARVEGYQDGSYDALNSLAHRIVKMKMQTSSEVLTYIRKVARAMQVQSERRLGDKPVMRVS